MVQELLASAAGILALITGATSTGEHRPLPFMRNEVAKHATSSAGTFDMTCVKNAVAAREATLGTAVAANTQAMTTAYSTRASALASAYSQTGKDTIKTAVKSAWANFKAAMRVTHKDWKTAQQAAWTQFKTAVKACGPGATAVVDSANASADANVGGGSSE